jgi:hypothetical protein
VGLFQPDTWVPLMIVLPHLGPTPNDPSSCNIN